MLKKKKKHERDIEVRGILHNQIAEKRIKEAAEQAQNKVFIE